MSWARMISWRRRKAIRIWPGSNSFWLKAQQRLFSLSQNQKIHLLCCLDKSLKNTFNLRFHKSEKVKELIGHQKQSQKNLKLNSLWWHTSNYLKQECTWKKQKRLFKPTIVKRLKNNNKGMIIHQTTALGRICRTNKTLLKFQKCKLLKNRETQISIGIIQVWVSFLAVSPYMIKRVTSPRVLIHPQ